MKYVKIKEQIYICIYKEENKICERNLVREINKRGGRTFSQKRRKGWKRGAKKEERGVERLLEVEENFPRPPSSFAKGGGGRVQIGASCQGQRSLNVGKDFDSGDAVPQ